jgi:hypothetical protein
VTPLELTGLKASHPLGFLAACGALRCCSVEGKRGAKLAWRPASDGSEVAVLTGIDNFDLESLTAILILRAVGEKDSKALGWSDRIDDRAEFKKLGAEMLRHAASPEGDDTIAWLPAFSSEIVGTKNLQPTLLSMTSASQGFLKAIRTLAADLSKTKKRKGQQPLQLGADAIREALCGPWRYADKAHSLGWDPQTQRLHALRNKLPAIDKENRSTRGAVFLASQAIPLFPCFSVRGKLRTTGFLRRDREDWFAWPIWSEPISLITLQSLLAQPLDHNLKRRGINAAYRCLVAHTGGGKSNYRVFGNAVEHPLERSANSKKVFSEPL